MSIQHGKSIAEDTHRDTSSKSRVYPSYTLMNLFCCQSLVIYVATVSSYRTTWHMACRHPIILMAAIKADHPSFLYVPKGPYGSHATAIPLLYHLSSMSWLSLVERLAPASVTGSDFRPDPAIDEVGGTAKMGSFKDGPPWFFFRLVSKVLNHGQQITNHDRLLCIGLYRLLEIQSLGPVLIIYSYHAVLGNPVVPS